MAEHFQQQREGTRQLLQTVDETLDGMSAVAPVAQDVPKPAPRPPAPRRKTETEVEGGSPARVVTTGRVITRENVPVAPPKTQQTQGPKVAKSVAKSSLGLWAGMLVLGGLLGLGGMELRQALLAEPASAPGPARDPSPLLPLGPSRPEAPAPSPEAAPASPPAVESEKAPASTGETAGAAARPGKQGLLTLVTLPEAEVFLNGRSLGKTPLFKKPVPVGQLRLFLQGQDGKRRELFAPIEQGKLTTFNLSLADLPPVR
jgi:serine/threonine-protein kinase